VECPLLNPVKANELSALDALRRIEDGSLTARALTDACLERIADREDTIGAWKFIDPDMARKAAQTVDDRPMGGKLRGLPVAVKDLFDTVDMPTGYGSPIYDDCRPASDAATVTLTRAADGVILGKTVTTEFAYFSPGKTANPHNPAHTPGGSSSGSAAAVADFMTPLAFGSQTVGSTIRPASFCGVVGFKPSYRMLDRTGIRPLADNFDTVGLFARDVADVAHFASALNGRANWRLDDAYDGRARIGLCHTPEWPEADQDTRTALETAARLAAEGGAMVKEIMLPEIFNRLGEAQGLIVDYQAATSAAFELAFHHDQVSKSFAERADAGATYTFEQFDQALATVTEAQAAMDSVMDGIDVLLCPSAPGEAPEGLDATGSPVFNRLGTALQGPCLNVPGLTSRTGMPVGVQLLGRMNDDCRTLAVGAWLQKILRV
jgi:Asp-tRNA(Asn)/Glu-tRNA(Gln) amidotransferase A subunit family amidase